LNIKYRPLHYNFHTTYAYHELPGAVVEELRKLYFVKDGEHLKECRERAEKWFWETIAGIDQNEIKPALSRNGITTH
jgi:hypothetical protein